MTKTKPLTRCEDCKKPLPVHLAEIGLTDHICACTAFYKVVKGKFVRDGNQRNPVAEYDKEQAAKKKAGKKNDLAVGGPIFITLVHKGKGTEYGFDIMTAEAVVADMKKQIAAAKRIMGGRDRRRPSLKLLVVPKKEKG